MNKTAGLILFFAVCNWGPDSSLSPSQSVSELKQSFPLQASTIFSKPASSQLRAEFPVQFGNPLRFVLPDGFRVEVMEEGAKSRYSTVGETRLIWTDRGSSFWTSQAKGYEEWLLVKAPAVGIPVGTWTIKGAVLRDASDVIQVLDVQAHQRMTITAPAVLFGSQALWLLVDTCKPRHFCSMAEC